MRMIVAFSPAIPHTVNQLVPQPHGGRRRPRTWKREARPRARPRLALNSELIGGEAMTAFARSKDLRGAEFIGADLRGARFAEADLAGVVMRRVNAGGGDIDDPFLSDGGSVLRVTGVDVPPFVEAELNRRCPGRSARRAQGPDGLRAAGAALE